MLIPLGILAVAGAVTPTAAGDYDLLTSTTLGTATASLSFDVSSYTDYKHLQIRMVARSNRASTNEDHYYIRFNNDSAANYRHHYLTGTGTTVASGDPTSSYPNGAFNYFGVTASTSDANSFGASVVDILDLYQTKNKTVRFFSGMTSLNRIALSSAVWLSTATVSSVQVVCVNGSFVPNTRIALYGLKG